MAICGGEFEVVIVVGELDAGSFAFFADFVEVMEEGFVFVDGDAIFGKDEAADEIFDVDGVCEFDEVVHLVRLADRWEVDEGGYWV